MVAMEENRLPAKLEKNNLAWYVAPFDKPHFGGMRFRVPTPNLDAGVVVYVSGLTRRRSQPMLLAITPDLLYLGDVEGTAWWKPYQSILEVTTTSVATNVPVPTAGGGTTILSISQAPAVKISFPADYGGGRINLILATLHPQEAQNWVASIEQARIEYQDRARSSE